MQGYGQAATEIWEMYVRPQINLSPQFHADIGEVCLPMLPCCVTKSGAPPCLSTVELR